MVLVDFPKVLVDFPKVLVVFQHSTAQHCMGCYALPETVRASLINT